MNSNQFNDSLLSDNGLKDLQLVRSNDPLDNRFSDNDTGKSVSISSNLDGPSEQEMETLRHVADKLPVSAWLVAVVELCERFSYYGLSGPFMNYMMYGPNDATKGALGLGQSSATALSYFFQFWCYLTPIFGAFIADTYLGKYKTILYFSLIYIIGIAVLFITSLPMAIKSGASMGGLVVAMIIIGLGTGGIKSNVSPLIAEQYTNTKHFIRVLKSGERVIVNPNVTIQSIFMIFYLCINIGSLSAIATTTIENKVGFWAAYLLPLCFFTLGLLFLFLGRNKYIKKPPMGSVIPDCFKIITITMKNKGNFEAAKPSIREEKGESRVTWTDLYVEEVRTALNACKVFVFYPIYWVVYGQMVNSFISQASTMETHGIPNDIMQNIDPLSMIIFIPICDRLLYPALRRIGIKFKPITRITWGFLFSSIAMAYAAIIQNIIYNSGPCYKSPLNCDASENGTIPNKVHVAYQTPAYVFIAFAEIFASVTGLEYAYIKAPENMKSFIMSMFLLTNAFGSAIGMAVSPAAKDPNMVWVFTGLSIATFLAGCIFWGIFHKYNEMEDENISINVIDADSMSDVEEVEVYHRVKGGEV